MYMQKNTTNFNTYITTYINSLHNQVVLQLG